MPLGLLSGSSLAFEKIWEAWLVTPVVQPGSCNIAAKHQAKHLEHFVGQLLHNLESEATDNMHQ